MTARGVALVTGAAQGLGFAIAERLAREGIHVALADIQEEKVRRAADRIQCAADKITSSRPTAIPVVVDVTSAESVSVALLSVASAFGRLDFLVNAAGLSGQHFMPAIEDIDDSTWDAIIDSHILGAFLCARAALPFLKQSGEGRILNFSSGAVRGIPFRNTIGVPLAYSTAKAALHGFTNQLALDLVPQGVCVNLLQPGFVLTESGASVRRHFESLPEADRTGLLGKLSVPPRQPAEIGWAVAFLMSPAARGITGKCVRLDGEISGIDLELKDELETPFGAFVTLRHRRV